MPTNRQNNSSPTRVEPKNPSKEFHAEADNLTIEVLHAARLLTEHFEKLGYDQWILLGVCSRKLLEKVQQRVPNPQYVNAIPEPRTQGSIDTDAYMEQRRQERLNAALAPEQYRMVEENYRIQMARQRMTTGEVPLPQMMAQAHEQAQEQRAAIERREFAEQQQVANEDEVINAHMTHEALEQDTPF